MKNEIKYWDLAREYARVTGDDWRDIPGALLYSLEESVAREMLQAAIEKKKKIKTVTIEGMNDGEFFYVPE